MELVNLSQGQRCVSVGKLEKGGIWDRVVAIEGSTGQAPKPEESPGQPAMPAVEMERSAGDLQPHMLFKHWGAPLTPVIDNQTFRFPEEDEEIKEGENINPITNYDIISYDIPLPPLSTPINIIRRHPNPPNNPKHMLNIMRQKKIVGNATQNFEDSILTWILFTGRSDYESVRISWVWEKWSLEDKIWLKHEETTNNWNIKSFSMQKKKRKKTMNFNCCLLKKKEKL
ncbi:hypothetical protein PPACK8108_LOCUS6131 [Phakopsora pachyrhizi]|uniref:Uncharacterized protein n=1 Tax=Phakopsora pachyrhizi TaxID=170000 RepID=A0AAV0AQA3_PHAPC|nr:hypothetical protein PPACK8108_LOCUS6131 [Phakopsora pachyrhizi]